MSRVRIVGGAWRSRLIEVAHAPGLRPTPDRVRETLFNWLGQDLTGRHCLDLFAGSGILGLEAASRGAERVTLVERNARVAHALQQSMNTLAATRVELVRGDALEFVRSTVGRYDVVFLDPPYNQGWLARLEPLLGRLVQPDGWLYVESEAPLAQLGDWRTVKQGKAGQVNFHLMQGTGE